MTEHEEITSAFGALETTEPLTMDQIEAKARDLLAQLSLEEKIGLMHGDPPFWSGMLDMAADGYHRHVQVAGAVPRLGIPGIRFSDGPRGVVLPGATTFPVAMARGASWDVELQERVGDAMGRELRALGGNHFGGLCINVVRHPAWGRAQESYGEDSFHLGALGAAFLSGVQRHSSYLGSDRIIPPDSFNGAFPCVHRFLLQDSPPGSANPSAVGMMLPANF